MKRQNLLRTLQANSSPPLLDVHQWVISTGMQSSLLQQKPGNKVRELDGSMCNEETQVPYQCDQEGHPTLGPR